MATRLCNRRARLVTACLALTAAVLAASGCGKRSAELTGTVSYKKKLLPFGWVKAQGSDGVFRDAEIKSDGTYHFAELPLGETKFTVSCVDPKIEEHARKLLAHQRSGDKLGGGLAVSEGEDPFAKFYLIPKIYEDVTQSGLEFKIEPGSNTYNIELP